MSNSKFNDDHVPEDVSFNLVVLEDDQRSQSAYLPSTLDQSFVRGQLVKIQDSPSMVANYFRQLRARFNTKAQIKVLNQLEQYNHMVAQGVASQAAITRARTGLIQAEKELEAEQKDTTSVDDEIELKKLDRERQKAELQRRIDELKPDTSKDKSDLEGYEEQKRISLEKAKIDRKYGRRTRIDGMAEALLADQEKKAVFEQAEAKIREKYEGRNDPESLRKLANELEDLENKMYKILDKED